MKLSIQNFAKIRCADVNIDGITVIAGNNNTGKSTVGKIVFALFNSLSNIEEKLFDERLRVIEKTSKNILKNNIDLLEGPKPLVLRNTVNVTRRIRMELRRRFKDEQEISFEGIEAVVNYALQVCQFNASPDELIEELVNNIAEVFALSEDVITKEALTSYFNKIFHSQISSVSMPEGQKTIVELEIKGKKDIFEFVRNECISYQGNINIVHKAIYIDNPFIIDELTDSNQLSPMNEMLREQLADDVKENLFDGIIESVRAKEKLNDIYMTLQNVVEGEIVLGKDAEYYLQNNDFSEPISFHNLSAGLKSFVIIKMLLEEGRIQNKDVLILDEPEIHLHPQWQIAYAELIVLLQKHFDLSVIVTTHSPYFVDAINLFSCKYGIDRKVNYYLSSMNDNYVDMQCVTNNIDLIYQKMASPISILESLRYELNNN